MMPPPISQPPRTLTTEIMPTSATITLERAELTRLRELRAELQDLQIALDSVRKGESALTLHSAYLRKSVKDIKDLISAISTIRDDNVGDPLRHLLNSWEQMMTNPLLKDPEANFQVQDQLQYVDILGSQIQRMVFLIGFITIPTRLNDWLKQARPGYYIPFHLVFDDELPNHEDRVKLLSLLAWSPNAVTGGIIDVANGLIYRYAEAKTSRTTSFLLLSLVLVIFTAIVVGACYVPVPGWPIQSNNLSSFLVGWGAVLIGIVTHIGVGSVKRAQAQGGLPPIIAVGDFFLIVNAKAGQILLKLFQALIGFFGLVFGTGVGNVTPFNAFLLGYSLDSFIELFRSSIEQRASGQVATLKKQLGVL